MKNETYLDTYENIYNYLQSIPQVVDAHFDVDNIYINEKGEIVFCIDNIDLNKSHEAYQDYGFDFNDFYNGENHILKALQWRLDFEGYYGLKFKPQLEPVQNQKLTPLDDYLKQKYLTEIKQQKETLKNSKNSNIFNSEEAVLAFSNLAQQQRQKPESAMLKLQYDGASGSLGYLLEHVGDLTHRISQSVYVKSGDIEHAIFDIMPKIEKAIEILSIAKTDEYILRKKIEDTLRNNYNYHQRETAGFNKKHPSFSHFLKNIKEKLKIYSEAHAELKVFNPFQKLCRDAAVDIGNFNFADALQKLEQIKTIILTNNFVTAASVYENADGDINKPNAAINRNTKKTKAAAYHTPL